ncbi:hypothetical protein L218DRAFT_964689 [Marasmius fiardii PR-910]|nr:hypothetical protein L218DRAFT_964689 [Marasmius fiardii PR-910]
MPILSLCYVTVFPSSPLSPFSCTLQISPDFLTNAAESLITCAPLRDFVHLVSDPPQMLGSILCRLVSLRVNGEFHTVH